MSSVHIFCREEMDIPPMAEVGWPRAALPGQEVVWVDVSFSPGSKMVQQAPRRVRSEESEKMSF